MTANAIGLKYAVELAGERLRISYRVTNGSERRIFLTTPLVQIDDDAITPAPGRAYAYLDPDGILHITRRVWSVPDDTDIYLPEVPRLTEVHPGVSFEDRFDCAAPVEVHYPYRFAGEEEPATAPEVLTAEAYGVAFSIGYLMEGAGSGGRSGDEDGFSPPATTREKRAEEGGLVVSYAIATAHQKLLQGAVVAMRVGVQDVNRQES